MLNIFTSQKVRSRMESGPMGPYLFAVAAELQQQGYAESTIRRHLRRAFQTGGWEEPRLIRLDRLAPSWKAILSPKLIVSTPGFVGSTRCSGGAFW